MNEAKSVKNQFRFKWICYLCGLTGLVAGITGFVCQRLFSEGDIFYALIFAPLFFFVCELITILVVEKNAKLEKPRKIVNIYLLLKTGKLFLTLIYITVYALVVKEELKWFVLVFVLLYFVYLLFDTLYLTNREKKLKKK